MRLLLISVLLALMGLSRGILADDGLPPVKVFAPKVCVACIEWAEHLRQNGFVVTMDDTQDMAAIKKRFRITPELEARHTAVIAGYFIEGHVPAEDVKLLLAEKPKARGLAVPGSPRGAPGLDVLAGTGCETGCTMLEGDGAANRVRRELYNTLLVGKDGRTSVFARH
jgi:hypothetical protein